MIGNLLFDPEFQEAARNRDRIRDMPLPPFVGLAHIDQHRTRLVEHAARFVDIDLFNRLARFVEDVL